MAQEAAHDLEAVIFDYGAVLCRPPSPQGFERFAKIAGMEPAKFQQTYWATRAPYDRGGMDAAAYWDLFGGHAGVRFTSAQVEELARMDVGIWRNMDPEMLALAAAIRDAGLRTAILSNMPYDLLRVLRVEADWLNAFEVGVFSCETGFVKPEPQIYQITLDKLGLRGSQTFFVDDAPANVKGAEKAGIRATVFKSLPELKTALNGAVSVR